MTRRQRLRRAGILCCHFLRNLAFYKAGWKKGEPIRAGQFWINANGNFLDICVLEWCKLFADKKAKQGWRRVVSDPITFYAGLLESLGLT
ncbi:hypothetical protein PQR34_45335, partial [Paraburkholderia sediminicola]|uniref:hypothetical protein n=1 Tax=Paraburkholderia sediminicola TaxID=458836 RepID=UPI0038BDB0F2